MCILNLSKYPVRFKNYGHFHIFIFFGLELASGIENGIWQADWLVELIGTNLCTKNKENIPIGYSHVYFH